MKIDDFRALTDVEQEEIIFDSGEFLGNDNIENTMFDIYRIDDFYVQFSYEMSKNVKATITACKDPQELFFFNKMGVFTL